MASLGHFASGFLQAFGLSKERKKEREDQEKEKKARVALFELQLEREKRAQQQESQQLQQRQSFFDAARQKLSAARPLPGTGVMLGDVDSPGSMDPNAPQSLSALLADPDMALQALQGGIVEPGALMQKPEQLPEDIRELMVFSQNPQLFELAKQLRQASSSTTNVNLGNEGLSKPPPGYARPDPREPGLKREVGGPPTPGQESLDKAFGADAAAWVAAGGFADTQKSIAQLGEAKAALEAVVSGESKDQLTGPLVAKIPDFAKPLFNPKAIAVRESVEEIVQRNLRLVLGAQFTEKEGERLIARAYNENLSEAENAKRVGRLIKQLGSAARAKQEAVDYFNENGTLEGFTGKVWTLADFEPEQSAAPNRKTIDFSELPD